MSPGADAGPNFLLDWHHSAETQRHVWAGTGSVLVHVGILALLLAIGDLGSKAFKQGPQIVPDFRQAVHLVLPAELSQKAPNKGKVAKEVNVEDLKPRPPSEQKLPPAPAVRSFKPPKLTPPGPPQP